MSETLVVSGRGQITLPAALRKRLGIKSGDVVILEERDNEVLLKPAIVLEVQHYSDEQIAQWDAEDKLSAKERAQVLDTLATSGQLGCFSTRTYYSLRYITRQEKPL